MDDSGLCKLKFNKKIDKRAPTFLVDFSNGFVNINSNQSLNYECYRFSEDSEHRGARRILVANNGRMNYSSANDLGPTPMRYFVGVRNKSTGRIRMYDAIAFHLRPLLKSTESKPTTLERSYKENVDDLISKFGSKNSKRAMGARHKYAMEKMDIEEIQENHPMIDFVSPVPEKAKDNLSANVSNSLDYIPPQNAEAPTIYEVYNINDIITEEELQALGEQAKVLLEATPELLASWEKGNTYCKYVLSHIEDGITDFEKVQYLVYYNYLVAFLKLKYADIIKKDPAPHIPEPFKKNMLNNFTLMSTHQAGRYKRTFSLKMKDKLLSYMMVLALFIDDFRVNTALVQSDLKLGMASVLNVSQALGCHISSHKMQDTAVKFAELRLPLKVFAPRLSKKRYF